MKEILVMLREVFPNYFKPGTVDLTPYRELVSRGLICPDGDWSNPGFRLTQAGFKLLGS